MILEILKRIKIQLFFPCGNYEGQASNLASNEGELNIESFYPFETGPLPKDNTLARFGEPFLHRGYLIGLPGLPEDEIKLWQIKAKFVLDDKPLKPLISKHR
jgi:hypothetical protein